MPPFFLHSRRLIGLSERYNGRDPVGARTLSSPRQLSAEFDSFGPPVLHHHRLATRLNPNLLLRVCACIQREYNGGITKLSNAPGTSSSTPLAQRHTEDGGGGALVGGLR